MTTIREAYDGFLYDCRIDNLQPTSIRWYRYMLAGFLEEHEDDEVGAVSKLDVMQHLRTQSRRGLSPYSVHGCLRAVRRLFSWCIENELLRRSPAEYVKPPRLPKALPKAISMLDVKKLLAECAGGDPIDARDRAAILLMLDTGCRVAGLLGLEMDDIDAQRALVTLMEKDGPRLAPLSWSTIDIVRAWVAVRPYRTTGALFVSMTTDSALTKWGLRDMLNRRAASASVTGPHNAHAFRHAFAREYLLNGGDLATLAQIMGHSDPAITRRYYAVFTVENLRHPHFMYSPARKLAGERP